MTTSVTRGRKDPAIDANLEWRSIAAYAAGLSIALALDVVEAPLAMIMVGLRILDTAGGQDINGNGERLSVEFLRPLRALR